MWANLIPNKGAYNSVLRLTGNGMEALREMFPDGLADPDNMVLFSTGGVHGTYVTIEMVEAAGVGEVTFCVVQPRIVCMRYGNAKPVTPGDLAFLKTLRASSHCALASVGGRQPGHAAERGAVGFGSTGVV